MSDREEEPRPARRSKGGQSPARYLYGALLVAIGGCLGIVIGSVSDTPRILFERLRGPVETVDLEPAVQPPGAPAAAQLEAFGELQGAAKAAPKPAPKPAETAKLAEPAKPKAVAAPAPPAAPSVSSPPPAPAAAAAPAKSPDEIVRDLEKKTAAPAPAASTVVQVLSLADKKQADAMIAKLKTKGFEPYATPMPNKPGKLRVRVRPKGGETTAALEARLRELGFKTWTTAE